MERGEERSSTASSFFSYWKFSKSNSGCERRNAAWSGGKTTSLQLGVEQSFGEQHDH
ncbi:hypothetical protein SAMN02799630_02028 [Paenibacillus sp. UNCCL117]|nr:hypothetical protein SAMN04488602_10599 [Paenibacillus sp. cl123]SFW32317.1 hypothetical protein SAMN02799630_02028 [Paenibacillus sp. UNCCL117]